MTVVTPKSPARPGPLLGGPVVAPSVPKELARAGAPSRERSEFETSRRLEGGPVLAPSLPASAPARGSGRLQDAFMTVQESLTGK